MILSTSFRRGRSTPALGQFVTAHALIDDGCGMFIADLRATKQRRAADRQKNARLRRHFTKFTIFYAPLSSNAA